MAARPTPTRRQANHAALRREAVAHIRRTDPVLGAVITRVGRCAWNGASDHTHFGFVLRSIVYKQLSGKAAATIFSRVTALYEIGRAHV